VLRNLPSVEERWTDPPADLVAHDVPGERGGAEDHARHDDVDVERPGAHEQPHGEQQGVAGEDREEQAALDEDDRHRRPEHLVAEPVEPPRGVHPVEPEQQRRQQVHAETLTGGRH
jgi:hypothetical protein